MIAALASIRSFARRLFVPDVIGVEMVGDGLTSRLRQILDEAPTFRVSRSRVVGTIAICALSSALFAAATLAPQDGTDGKGRMDLAPTQVSGQPRFDVVSVKPCEPNAPGPGRGGSAGTASPGRLRIECQSLFSLMRMAYQIYAGGRVNAPSTYPTLEPDVFSPKAPQWMVTERFTIEATTEIAPPPATAVMQGPMLQALLEDRFRLKMHREMRQMPINELVVSKSGAKVKPFTPGACVPYDWSVSPQPPLEAGQRRCDNSTERDASRAQWVETAEATTLDELAAMIGSGPDRTPVVNKTGIAGLVAFRFTYTDHDSFVAALEDQLGLELRPAKGSRDFLVIDHVERPSANAQGALSSIEGRPTLNVVDALRQAPARVGGTR